MDCFVFHQTEYDLVRILYKKTDFEILDQVVFDYSINVHNDKLDRLQSEPFSTFSRNSTRNHFF